MPLRQWNVGDVVAWLHESNLGQHAVLFTDNDINGSALLQLDQSTLKEMGIPSMGERLRIVAAVRALHKRLVEVNAHRQQPTWADAQFGIAGHNARAKPSVEWLVAAPEPEAHRHPSPGPSYPGHTMVRHESDIGSPLSARTQTPLARHAPAVPPSVRRPNTATGISSGPWPVVSTPTSIASIASPGTQQVARPRRPATSSSTSPQNVGYAVGRGAFSASIAAKQRVAQISAPYNLRRGDSESDSDSARDADAVSPGVPQFKGVHKALIKFFAEDGTSRVVDVSECHDAHEVLVRVLRKFGLPQVGAELESVTYMNPYAMAMAGGDGKPKVLSESELMTVCSTPHAFTPVWHNGLLLIDTTLPLPGIAEGDLTMRRASTFSILSGLGVENLPPERSPLPTNTASFARRAARPAVAMAAAAADPLKAGTRVRRRVRNFFGQRPPSELISSHLAEYFPETDSRELQRHSRASLGDISMLQLPNAGSVSPKELQTPSVPHSAQPLTPRSPLSPSWADGRGLPPMRRFAPEAAEETQSPPPPPPPPPPAEVDDETSSLVTMDEITQDLEERNAIDMEPAGQSSVIVDQDGVPIPVHGPRAREPSAQSLAYVETAPQPLMTPAATRTEGADTEAPKPRIRWHKGALIGAGSFGKVFLGMNAKTGLLMAVKQVELPTTDETNTQRRQYMVESLESEIALLKTIQHPNIVHYLDSYADGEFLNIFLEYVPGGSVVALLRNYGAFEEQLVQNFVRQILQGLRFLHAQAIVHRDIKGANILVDNKGGVKISDFGISKKGESGLLVQARGQRGMLQGSVYWMAPEVVKQTSYTPKADVWSVGCLVVEMLTALHPWPKLDQMQALFQIGMSKHPALPDDISAPATDFLKATFAVQEDDRPSAEQLLEHVFITQPPPDTPAEGL